MECFELKRCVLAPKEPQRYESSQSFIFQIEPFSFAIELWGFGHLLKSFRDLEDLSVSGS